MKKPKNAIVLFAMSMICMLLLCACGIKNPDSSGGDGKTDSKTDSETESSEKKLSDIIVHDFYPAIDYKDERFYEDEEYWYVFEGINSSFMTAVYTDGSEQELKDAIKEGIVTPSDLDAFPCVRYHKEPKIVDIIAQEISVDQVEERFYEDSIYFYSFPTPQSSYTIVEYSDGKKETIKEALKTGRARISDLDDFGIVYYTEIKPVKDPDISYTVQHSFDYAIPTDLLSMLDSVDLVVEGVYRKKLSTYATADGRIISIGSFGDVRVLKGDPDKISDRLLNEELEIGYYGGALPVSDFMKYADSSVSAKYGFDRLTKYQADTRYIGDPVTERSAAPSDGSRYLIFLLKDGTGDLFVACDGYGLRMINSDGAVKNPDSGQFEPFEISGSR